MKRKIAASFLVLFLLFPAPAYAAFDADLIAYFNSTVIPALTPLTTLVQQGIQNLKQLQDNTNLISQVQVGINAIKDMQNYQLQQQNGANSQEYREYLDYLSAQKQNNLNLSKLVSSYGVANMYLRLDNDANISTIGWDNAGSLLAILSTMDNKTLATTLQFDWDFLEYSIEQWRQKEEQLKMQQIAAINANSSAYYAGNKPPVVAATGAQQGGISGAITSNTATGTGTTSTGGTQNTQVYSETKDKATKALIEQKSTEQLAKLEVIKEKIAEIKKAMYAAKAGQYDSAIVDAKKTMGEKQAEQQKGDYFEKAAGIQ